jgi:signal transduction histidine kinase
VSHSLPLVRLKNRDVLHSDKPKLRALFRQRLVWGALAGLFFALMINFAPLESLEMGMLEEQYKLSNQFTKVAAKADSSREITIVKFDDPTQFDFALTRFNDFKSQKLLAQLIEHIETFNPSMVVLDVDLRGATEPSLVNLMKRNRHIVLSLFGSGDEGGNDLPSSDFLTHAAAYGREQLTRETNGVVYELPVTYPNFEESSAAQRVKSNDPSQNPFAYVPSLAESVVNLSREIRGVGPDTNFLVAQGWTPFYLSPSESHFPTVSFESALPTQLLEEKGLEKLALDKDKARQLFASKIVFVGAMLTPQAEAGSVRAKKSEHQPSVFYQAKAVQTLLSGEQISTFPQGWANLLLIILGTAFGAWCTAVKWLPRTTCYAFLSALVAIGSALAFQHFGVIIPVVAPLAVLTGCFILSSFIYMDANLRDRNVELAEARRSMQVRAEEERQRIAEDLHDETLPALSAVARMADKLASELTDNPVPVQMREKLDFSVVEMRRVINDLHPSVLETMGFTPALENLLVMLERDSHFQTAFFDNDAFDEALLSKFTKLQLYRIVQEALNNVQKHSRAQHVEVALRSNGNTLTISISDDGIGIPDGAVKSESHGVLNIKQRAQLISARVDWNKPTKFEKGTELKVELPLEPDAEENE